ncbi:MAG: DUF2807 domain-containing protein [Flavobacterium sp.]|nr:MAG: DUF2807 domain-containing protein [Flavobacterium sp.]
MKSLINFVIMLSLVLMSSGEALAQWGSKKVEGNGNVTTRTVNTSNYDAIKNFGSIDVHLRKGTEGTIMVKTDENLQEYIIVEVVNNALKIRTENNVSLKTRKGIHVYVPFDDISEVSLTGSGDVDTEDTINGDELKLKLTGSGDVDLVVGANSVNATLTGSGDVAVRGTTTNLNVKITGSGDFNGNDLRAQNTEVTVSGSGDASVYASKFLKARVHGSGDVRYNGNPDKRDTKVSGSGRISMN